MEDFRFQPEESTVETEEPLSARRWGPRQGALVEVGEFRGALVEVGGPQAQS